MHEFNFLLEQRKKGPQSMHLENYRQSPCPSGDHPRSPRGFVGRVWELGAEAAYSRVLQDE